MSQRNDTILTSLRQLQGRTFHGQYGLVSVLGEGAMGVVFRAEHLGMKRAVALKLMKIDDAAQKSEALRRFQEEIRVVANLSHPNIVRVFDSGYEPVLGLHYVSMELVEGPTLADLLDTHRCHPALALDIVHQICSGLTEPHSLNIVHRDLKPENISLRLRSDGGLQVKILDFGIAKAIQRDIKITQTGMVLGTPAYMSPELCLADPIDARTDLYALGIMLYEMITGTLPFRGETPLQVVMKHVHETVPPLPPGLVHQYPGLQHLLASLTASKPEDRIASALHACKMIDTLRSDPSLKLASMDPNQPLDAALGPWLEPLGGQQRDLLESERLSRTFRNFQTEMTFVPTFVADSKDITQPYLPSSKTHPDATSSQTQPLSLAPQTAPDAPPPAARRTGSRVPLLAGLGALVVAGVAAALFMFWPSPSPPLPPHPQEQLATPTPPPSKAPRPSPSTPAQPTAPPEDTLAPPVILPPPTPSVPPPDPTPLQQVEVKEAAPTPPPKARKTRPQPSKHTRVEPVNPKASTSSEPPQQTEPQSAEDPKQTLQEANEWLNNN